MNWTRGRFVCSDDKGRLKVGQIQPIMKQGYWSSHYSADTITRLLQTSFWLSIHLKRALVGFARVVTDKTTVSLITDLIIHQDYRGNGHGAWLMSCLLEHPDLKETSMSLGTQDADAFFEKFGFERDGALMHRAPNTPPPPPPPPLKPRVKGRQGTAGKKRREE
jgi:ribosomal protein S18 acetylase RimI-like enzyme